MSVRWVRHYTFSSEDLALINRRRGDANRLGFALMLCYLRFPGRILQQGEQPPAALCTFIAEQLGLVAAHFGDYAERHFDRLSETWADNRFKELLDAAS